ncbi:hypothetical protein R1flu_001025 [Riccia fluitans]|uniref:Uncharacterized protein n=1 Tax=Riccia fluitans TaxID=41844 RepID=A0ABD1Y242_9MARC
MSRIERGQSESRNLDTGFKSERVKGEIGLRWWVWILRKECLSQQLSQVRLAQPQHTAVSLTDWSVRALRDDSYSMSSTQTQNGAQST